MYERCRQSRFDARYWMLGAGALGRSRGMVWGGRKEEGSGWETRVYLWWIHVDIWQNQYNIVKLKNKIKKKKKEMDMEQQTDSKSGKEYIKAAYCHPAYLSYMQSTSCGMLGWMKHKLESRLLGEISITSDRQMKPHLWQKVKKN